MYTARPAAIVSMSLISPRISNSIMSYRYYDIPFCYGEPPNEPVEKVPTRKKTSELGVPKWSLDPRSSLKSQIRRSFFLANFRSTFFYRLNNLRLTGGGPTRAVKLTRAHHARRLVQ